MSDAWAGHFAREERWHPKDASAVRKAALGEGLLSDLQSMGTKTNLMQPMTLNQIGELASPEGFEPSLPP
jgi:hypothetical protein